MPTTTTKKAPEFEVIQDLPKGKKQCPHCGRPVGSNNFVRHVETHNREAQRRRPGRQPGPMDPDVVVSMGETRRRNAIITRYMEFLAAGGNFAAKVSLSGVNGTVGGGGTTNDPNKVDAAVQTLRAKVPTMPPSVQRLRTIQRIHDLQAAADRLRANQNGSNPEKNFTEIAAEWSIANGITYEAWRDAGVPARVLKAAGISR